MAAPDGARGIGIRPADLHIVDPRLATRVAAPTYDALSAAQRAQLAGREPLSFLNALRGPEDAGGDLASALEDNRAALLRLLRAGAYRRGTGRRYAWYRMAVDGHEQLALIAEVAVADYEGGRIVGHEHTNAARETQLAAYLETVRASANPIGLAHPPGATLRATAEAATAGAPVLAFTSSDGVEHTVWTSEDPGAIAAVHTATAALQRLYITDGHHRFAAAARVAAAGRTAGHGPDAPDQWALAALSCAQQLRVLPFHRAVLHPDHQVLRAALRERATVTPLAAPTPPAAPRHYTTFLDDRWYDVAVPARQRDGDALAALDVVVLQREILAPVFGVTEPRSDPRLHYVAGDATDLRAHCERTGAVGFVVRAPTMAELMTVADAHQPMPPKSTRFDPKARAGIFLRLLDQR